MSTIRILDLECQNLPWYGAVASPYNPENWIVMAGWRDDVDCQPGPVQVRHNPRIEDAEDTSWFNLEGVDYLVAFNAGYEISWFLSRHREEFEKFLKRGGRVLCSQMAEYILSDFQKTYPSLDETAPIYGGTHKIDAVKVLWQQGALTADIDPDLLREYLAGPGGDVENTAIAFYGQMAKLIERGQWGMFLERCESLLAFAYCTFSGLYVNMEIAEANLAKQEAELAELRKEADALLPELPERLTFNWGSAYHVSALLFGGPVKYQRPVPRTDANGEVMYEKMDCYKFGDRFIAVGDASTPDEFANFVAQYGNADRYKAGKNKGALKVHRVPSDVPMTKLADAAFLFKALVPIDELPKHIRENFDPKRGDWVGKRMLCDGLTPVYSTSGEVLEVLAKHGFEAANVLHRMAQLTKDNSTYYRNVEYAADGSVKNVKGMLQYVQPDGIVHHSLNVCATATGRLSASTPNLQNLPRDGTSKVKEMFTSRFGDAGRIIEVDYSALEVVMLAAISGDEALLDKLQNNIDMHCLRLAAKLGEPYEEVKRKAVDDQNHPDHKLYKQMRTDIKPPSFAAQYGASARGIAYATGCTVEYAEEFLATEAKLFPQSIGFRQVIRDAVEATGALPENMHREQSDDGRWTIYRRGYWQSPGGSRYSFRQYPKRVDGQQIMDYKDTQIANYGIQGEAFYLMAVSAGRVARWLLAQDFFRTAEFPQGRAFFINNVHDALYFDCHESVVREVALTVKAIMEDAPKYLSTYHGYNIAHVPFPAAAEAGLSMYSKEHIH